MEQARIICECDERGETGKPCFQEILSQFRFPGRVIVDATLLRGASIHWIGCKCVGADSKAVWVGILAEGVESRNSFHTGPPLLLIYKRFELIAISYPHNGLPTRDA